MQERANEVAGGVVIAAGAVTKAGQNRRFAGEDLKRGAVVFRAGQPLRPAELGMIASLGINEVPVFRRLRVAFFSTGDELVSIGQPLGTGQIYDSNRYTLHGMLSRLGCEIARHGRGAGRAGGAGARVRDGGRERGRRHHLGRRLGRRGRLREAAARPAGRGGVLEDRDEARAPARLRPHRRRALLRPARQPRVGDGDVLPVRARRAARAAGTQPTSRRCRRSRRRSPRRSARRRDAPSSSAASSRAEPDGSLGVRTTGDQGSGILSSMSQANCFIVLPPATGNVAAGEMVDVQLLEGLV